MRGEICDGSFYESHESMMYTVVYAAPTTMNTSVEIDSWFIVTS